MNEIYEGVYEKIRNINTKFASFEGIINGFAKTNYASTRRCD